MADTQQGVRHQSARDAAGTTDTYDGDLRALFNAVATVPAGSTFNEAFILWLQSVTGSSEGNINDLAALYASQQDDTYNWSSVGSLGLPVLFAWNPESEEDLPASATFARASVAFYRNDSGLWVEAASGALRYHNEVAGGGSKGYLPEPAAIKLALFPRDFTNAVWIASDITPVKDAVGIDGVANAASTLTATDANGTILQSFTRASSAHTFSVFVARKTGTGTIEITVDGGSTWVDITSSISSDIKDDPYIVTQTLANPSIGFRIVTSGDEIEVDMGDLEASAFATTPLDHTSSTATRVADDLRGPVWPSEHSAVADLTKDDNDAAAVIAGYASSTGHIFYFASNFQLLYLGQSSMLSTVFGTYTSLRQKVAFSAKSAQSILVDDQGADDTDTVGTPGTGVMSIGSANGINQLRGVIHNITIYSKALTVAQLEDLVV